MGKGSHPSVLSGVHFKLTPEVATTRGSILLAEDEPAIRYTFKTILEEAGYRVRAVPDFAAAHKAMGRDDYDAVVTDVSLEKEGLGLELAREAKQLKSAPAVVVYTDQPTVDRLRTALALKVDYFAFKPVDIEEIKSALFRLISRRTLYHSFSST